ncbi:Armadillo-type fold domain containing protein [Cordyceps fumosorosea ARSEF 2679]|uniref:Armadillo-type fold domain containing protein n=1 Tax=Cordyceps fumosorosea (strain ARSEF 2679) TaxID=1081104 RepID=A0A168BXE0_CORFA|nr:Armadillo-type fold domain containing protein [Cordyceps fumosorosea ARSEF 2679]OAA70670.1 Armadillo-type fold domain containing protein [Cordyceps fumosorosea ARSEF 2679]
MTPQDIEDLLKREGHGEFSEEYDMALETVSNVQRRTELLADVLKTCKELRAEDRTQLEIAAEKLGDGSRDEAWRVPYGNSGILDFFLEELAKEDITHKLKIHSLRVVGNSCAEMNKNRALMLQGRHMEMVIRQLSDESVVHVAIPVLYNIMVDYEPAQARAAELKISASMINLLSSPNLPLFMEMIPYIGRILALLVSNEAETDAAADTTVGVLLSVALNSPCKDDVEEFAALLSVIVAYLAADKFQKLAISRHQIDLFLEAFHHANTGFDVSSITDPEMATVLKKLYLSMLNMVAELTAQDDFPMVYPSTSTAALTVLAWLRTGNSQLQAAACLALGNMSRSDEAARALVEDLALQEPLIAILADPSISESQLLHAVLCLLKNIAIPAQNKLALRRLLDPACVPRIYSLDAVPQVQYAAASLTRLLLSNCADNVSHFCSYHSQSAVTTTSGGSDTEQKKDSVSDLLSLFGRTDTEPIKLEAARAVSVICRVLHSNAAAELLPGDGTASDSKSRAEFYAHHDVGTPLSFLITQKKWQVLRSEAWFVLALMSRSSDGSSVIAAILQQEMVASQLTETITGRKTDAQFTEVVNEDNEEATDALSVAEGLNLKPQRVDLKEKERVAAVERENALVMCTELLRNWRDDFEPLSRRFLESLLKEGAELVVAHRSEESIPTSLVKSGSELVIPVRSKEPDTA